MRRRDERGSVTPFVLIVSLAILALAALVIDGGRQLNSKGRAIAYAQEAARAGSQAVNVEDARLDLIPADAEAAATQYCQQAKAHDKELTSCSPTMVRLHDAAGAFYGVEVHTSVAIPSILLGMFGKQTLVSSGIALARPVSGTRVADQGEISTQPPPSLAPPGGGGELSTADPSEGLNPKQPIASCAPSSAPTTTTPTPSPTPPTDPPTSAPAFTPTTAPTDSPSPTPTTSPPTTPAPSPTPTIPICEDHGR